MASLSSSKTKKVFLIFFSNFEIGNAVNRQDYPSMDWQTKKGKAENSLEWKAIGQKRTRNSSAMNRATKFVLRIFS